MIKLPDSSDSSHEQRHKQRLSNAIFFANLSSLVYPKGKEGKYSNDLVAVQESLTKYFSNIGFEYETIEMLVPNPGLEDDLTDAACSVINTEDSVILSYKGTESSSKGDWLSNLNLSDPKLECDFDCSLDKSFIELIKSVGWTHGGIVQSFFRSLNNSSGLIPKLKAQGIIKDNKITKKLWITGHSRGGAFAILSALYLAQVYKAPIYGVYTFGQPKIGQEGFANLYYHKSSANQESELCLGDVTCVFWNKDDPVFKLPHNISPKHHNYHVGHAYRLMKSKHTSKEVLKDLYYMGEKIYKVGRTGPHIYDKQDDHHISDYLRSLNKIQKELKVPNEVKVSFVRDKMESSELHI